MFSFVLSACTVTQVEQDQYDEEIYAIYILAQEEGYEGEYEEWLNDLVNLEKNLVICLK